VCFLVTAAVLWWGVYGRRCWEFRYISRAVNLVFEMLLEHCSFGRGSIPLVNIGFFVYFFGKVRSVRNVGNLGI
jgi:hypothetical protein